MGENGPRHADKQPNYKRRRKLVGTILGLLSAGGVGAVGYNMATSSGEATAPTPEHLDRPAAAIRAIEFPEGTDTATMYTPPERAKDYESGFKDAAAHAIGDLATEYDPATQTMVARTGSEVLATGDEVTLTHGGTSVRASVNSQLRLIEVSESVRGSTFTYQFHCDELPSHDLKQDGVLSPDAIASYIDDETNNVDVHAVSVSGAGDEASATLVTYIFRELENPNGDKNVVPIESHREVDGVTNNFSDEEMKRDLEAMSGTSIEVIPTTPAESVPEPSPTIAETEEKITNKVEFDSPASEANAAKANILTTTANSISEAMAAGNPLLDHTPTSFTATMAEGTYVLRATIKGDTLHIHTENTIQGDNKPVVLKHDTKLGGTESTLLGDADGNLSPDAVMSALNAYASQLLEPGAGKEDRAISFRDIVPASEGIPDDLTIVFGKTRTNSAGAALTTVVVTAPDGTRLTDKQARNAYNSWSGKS